MTTMTNLSDPDIPEHINRNISSMWGTPELRDYLVNLIIMDRAQRRGFTKLQLGYLLFKLESHDVEFPQFVPSETMWSYIHRRN